MLTKTIDIIVREKLLDLGYPIHFYLQFLHHALRCLEEISLDHDLGESIKDEKISVNSHDRVAIPVTAIDIIGVYGLYGDEYKAFHYNENITKVYNKNSSDENISYPDTESTLPNFCPYTSSMPVHATGVNDTLTIYYPSDDYKYEFNVDRKKGEVIIGNGHGLESVFVIYLSTGVSKTVANVVHPYAAATIHTYMEYMNSRANGSPQSKVVIHKDEYYNAKRLLSGRLNPLSYKEIAQILNNN